MVTITDAFIQEYLRTPVSSQNADILAQIQQYQAAKQQQAYTQESVLAITPNPAYAAEYGEYLNQRIAVGLPVGSSSSGEAQYAKSQPSQSQINLVQQYNKLAAMTGGSVQQVSSITGSQGTPYSSPVPVQTYQQTQVAPTQSQLNIIQQANKLASMTGGVLPQASSITGIGGSQLSTPIQLQTYSQGRAVETSLASIAATGAQQRAGYYGIASEGLSPQQTIGDSKTQAYERNLAAMARSLEMAGMPVPTALQTEYGRTGLALEYQRQRATPTGSEVSTREAQYYIGEMQKWAQRPVEQSAEYHYLGKSLGIPVPANPYEYQADLGVELMKGLPTKSSAFFSPVSGELASVLPYGAGLQDIAWYTAKTGEVPRVSFMGAVGKVAAAEGQYGPYGTLYGGPSYIGTPSSEGLRKQADFVWTPALEQSAIAAVSGGATVKGGVTRVATRDRWLSSGPDVTISGVDESALPKPYLSRSASQGPQPQRNVIDTLWNMWETKTILPESQRVYLPSPNELFGSGGRSRFGDVGISIATTLYGIPYGQVKGAETVRAQEAYEKSPIYTQYSKAVSDYESSNAELQASLNLNKNYVHLDTTTGKYVISPETPTNVANNLMSKFETANAKSKAVSDLSSRVENYEYNSPLNRLQRETSASFGNQKPMELFGVQPTVAWKTGVDALTYGLVGGNTGALSGVTSKTATNPGESVLYGILDFPVMTLKAAADAPLGIEMAARDVINRGSGGISTVAGYGQARFGKYIVDDPIRAVTMLATGHIMGSVASESKQVVMQKTGLTRMSSFEVGGSEVVANAPATRTIADVMNKDTIDVTHSSPAPIRGGFVQLSRESAGDVAHGNAPAPGAFGAPIVKDVAGNTLFEPTSNYFLNKPLLWPAVVNTARAAYNLADATIHQTGYASTVTAARAAARGYANTIIKYTPIIGGSREYIIRNVQTLAPELRGQHANMAAEIRRQLETQGYIEPSLYDTYTQLAYEKSAASGGAPVAIIAPKKASGYHLGMKEAMGAPFESEVYMVSAREVGGVVTPSDMIRITSRDFKGYAYGPTGAKVVEVGVEGIHGTPRTGIVETMRENAAYNRDTFNSYYSPYPTLFSLNIGGTKIQRGWYNAAVQDAVLKAHEMYGEPGYWAPKGYYGQHGYEHSVAVAENIRGIISRSPETEARLGGAASAERYANVMGLSHDIAKIGEAESQPYTHAFITAEAMRSGQLQTSLGTTTYNRLFGGISRADIIETSKAVSEHTQIQPMRSPSLREVVSHPRSALQPVLGLISEAIWRPGTAGRTLATADRLDIGRVGMTVRESKLFRTPEEQREANIRTATNAAVIGSSALSVKMGLPPVVAGVMLSETMFGAKRGISRYSSRLATDTVLTYTGSGYKKSSAAYPTTNYGENQAYHKYQPGYQKAEYSKGYSKYNPDYSKYGPDYNPSYSSKYSGYSPSYDTIYDGYKKGYSKYTAKHEPKYTPSYSTYEPGYKPTYEKGYSPYKPYDEQPPPPYIGTPYGSPYGGGGGGTRKRRGAFKETFAFGLDLAARGFRIPGGVSKRRTKSKRR